MGQHQIQRQLLHNFSFQGRQPGSRETWWLGKSRYQPSKRSILNVGVFDVDCCEEVDKYIGELENHFAGKLQKFGEGEFAPEHAGRDIYDFVALHYIRSQGFRLQIRFLVDECVSMSELNPQQAEAEYQRLTSHQDAAVFRALVDSVSSVLTHYVLTPIMTTGQYSFITSNKIMNAAKDPTEEPVTAVWFPISPHMGLWIMSEDRAGQILGPMLFDQSSGRLEVLNQPEAPVLRCQVPSPQPGNADFINWLNGLMVPGSEELYGVDRADIDAALQNADRTADYRYTPPLGD